jgi:hypothetical protein
MVALAPAGSSQRKPGILPVTLDFRWGRELLERTPATKQMVILRRADHAHFMDDVEETHERTRKTSLDAVLKHRQEARDFLAGDVEAHLAARGVDSTSVPSTK